MAPVSGFIRRVDQKLTEEDEPYRIAGGNTYYLGYVPESTLDAALALAASFGMNAIRIWAFLDSPVVSTPGQVCFQYFDPVAGLPVIQDGPDGLERLDRAIVKAGSLGIRLILTLTNNWTDFGGMPLYAQWCGFKPEEKNQFYTDPRCRQIYRNWVGQLINRRNTISGRLYRDEPAILAWELANEPRCEGPGGLEKLLGWVDEMSRFVKGEDANHLVGVGDEGYFKHSFAGRNLLFNGAYGVSCEHLLGIGAVDFGTAHLYPQTMAKDEDPVEFGRMWIHEHLEAAKRANKPMLIEEYGATVGTGPGDLATNTQRNDVFRAWLQSLEQEAGLGDMLWMLGLPKSDTQPYGLDGYVLSDPGSAPAIVEHTRNMLAKPARP